jgi:alanine racemase
VPTSSPYPPTFVDIDLSSLAHNLRQVRQRLQPSCDILAIVKANAYGHGAFEITRALHRLGVRRFGVATVEEGTELRRAGIVDQIVVLGAVLPAQLPDLIAHGLTPVIYDLPLMQELVRVLSPSVKPYPIHIKVDTGMGRLGLAPEEVILALHAADLGRTLSLEGIMTHMADADNSDHRFTAAQIARFRSILDQLATKGYRPRLIHMANSAGVLVHPSAHFSMVRPGIMLYGYHTLLHRRAHVALRPVLSWHTTVAAIRTIAEGDGVSYNRTYIAMKPTRIAVLPVGYADGYSRLLSNKGSVLIGGMRAPVVGRVCMDMVMVDVTQIPQAKCGEPVVLIGQQGTERITVEDIAGAVGSISYEVLCSIGPRVRRCYSAGCINNPQ